MAEEHLVRFDLIRQAAAEFSQGAGSADPDADVTTSPQTSLAAEEKQWAELDEAARQWPDDARTNFELAGCCLRLFELHQQDAVNVMSLGQIRDAAVESHFSSRQALDEWLARAVGEHVKYLDAALQHTHRALALCPLLGEGYLYLGELSLPGKRPCRGEGSLPGASHGRAAARRDGAVSRRQGSLARRRLR